MGLIIIVLGPDMAFSQLPIIAYKSVNSFTLVALPGFILTGELLLKSNIGQKLFKLADRWVRHLPGGIAIATIIVCAFFAAIAGSSVATAMTIGALAAREMLAHGYPKTFAFGVIAAAGTLGILIPPSAPLIVYGALTDTSVLRLFTAAIIPGILLTLLFIIYVIIKTKKTIDRSNPATWKERFVALKEASWAMLIPITIFGGMYSGIFTPTEAAAVSAFITLILGVIIYKGINFKNIFSIFSNAASNTSMIFYIIIGASIFGHSLTIINLPRDLANFLSVLNIPSWVLIIAIVAIITILGMFLEVMSILLITVPILFPVMLAFDFDTIWMAIIIIITCEIALITPPIGLNLFVVIGVGKEQGVMLNIIDLAKAALPYVILMFILVGIIAIFPELALWLPSLLFD